MPVFEVQTLPRVLERRALQERRGRLDTFAELGRHNGLRHTQLAVDGNPAGSAAQADTELWVGTPGSELYESWLRASVHAPKIENARSRPGVWIDRNIDPVLGSRACVQARHARPSYELDVAGICHKDAADNSRRRRKRRIVAGIDRCKKSDPARRALA